MTSTTSYADYEVARRARAMLTGGSGLMASVQEHQREIMQKVTYTGSGGSIAFDSDYAPSSFHTGSSPCVVAFRAIEPKARVPEASLGNRNVLSSPSSSRCRSCRRHSRLNKSPARAGPAGEPSRPVRVVSWQGTQPPNPTLTCFYTKVLESDSYDIRARRVALQVRVGGLDDGSCGCLRVRGRAPVRCRWRAEAARPRVGLSHMQGGAPIGAAESGGDALVSFENATQGVPARVLAPLAKAPANHLYELTGEDGDEQVSFGADGLVVEDGAQSELGLQRAEHCLDVGEGGEGTPQVSSSQSV